MDSQVDNVREDDDEKIFLLFKEMNMKFLAEQGQKDKLFRSKAHHEYYKSLLARTVMNNRPIDFEYFEKASFQILPLLSNLHLQELCTLNSPCFLN